MSAKEDQKFSDAAQACLNERDMLLGALDSLNGGVIIIGPDQHVVAANRLAAPLLDVPEHYLEPKSDFREFARFAAERGDYGDGDPEAQFNRVISLLDKRTPYELTRTRPDGVMIEINGQPIAGGGYVTRFRDVTASRKTEQELAVATRSSERFQRFFELSQEMMGIADQDGRLHTMNGAWSRQLGWSAEELGEKPFIEFVSSQDMATVKAALQELISGKKAADFVVRFTCKSGNQRWLEWHVAPDSDGQLFCAVHDVDETHHHQEQLEDARNIAEAAASSKADFLATMSHEIRTPMNGIIGMANLLLDTKQDDEQKQYTRSVIESGEALLAIIDDILDLSKMEAGKLELDEHELSVEKIVRSAMEVTTPRAMEKRLELKTFVAPDVAGLLLGDAGKLRQILLNLLGNAVKFTESGSVSVRVTIDSEDTMQQHLRFEVNDTGIGISEEARSHLFKRYGQGDASTTHKYGGTGLGLSISKQLSEMMGGEIGFESEIDVGSTFWFTVNMKRVEPVTAEKAGIALVGGIATASAASAGASSSDEPADDDEAEALKPSSLRVLLVEDNAVNQMLAMAILKKAGHRVDLAADGVEAVEAASNNVYDVVLMDIQMPNMDGLEATRRIRAMDGSEMANVHIVAITANALLGDRETCLAAGMNDYLPKPIDQKRLLAALDQVSASAAGEPEAENVSSGAAAVIDEATFGKLEETVGAEAIADMVSITIADAPATMALIQAANAEGDLEKMYREAYDMGSSFGNIGAAKLAAHIDELTEACREGRAARASLLANQMPEILDEAVAAIKRRIAGSDSRVA